MLLSGKHGSNAMKSRYATSLDIKAIEVCGNRFIPRLLQTSTSFHYDVQASECSSTLGWHFQADTSAMHIMKIGPNQNTRNHGILKWELKNSRQLFVLKFAAMAPWFRG